MQSPSKIRTAVAIVTVAEENALRIRKAQSSRVNVADSKASEPGEIDSSEPETPNIFVWDRSGVIPQLVNIDTVCALLALKKSAVYDLVAKKQLKPPKKLSPGRRGAARWLLSDVVEFIQSLSVQEITSSVDGGFSSTEFTASTSIATATLTAHQACPQGTATGGAL
jgi:predicted DNA-binding transcriptional regulator AlpA